MKAQDWYFLSVSILMMKFIIKQVSIKKTVTKYIFSADMHLGDRLIKMAVICQRVVIWLKLCVDIIAICAPFIWYQILVI